MNLFEREADYDAFEKVLAEAVERVETRLLAYCLMPNHWHLVVWPRENGELSRFVGWLTLTHTQRWHAHRADQRCQEPFCHWRMSPQRVASAVAVKWAAAMKARHSAGRPAQAGRPMATTFSSAECQSYFVGATFILSTGWLARAPRGETLIRRKKFPWRFAHAIQSRQDARLRPRGGPATGGCDSEIRHVFPVNANLQSREKTKSSFSDYHAATRRDAGSMRIGASARFGRSQFNHARPDRQRSETSSGKVFPRRPSPAIHTSRGCAPHRGIRTIATRGRNSD
jgi:REP element-mobilizing transposase RayT